MSRLDWTKSETISPPDRITIKWKSEASGNNQPAEREQLLLSTTKSSSTSTYETFNYQDAEGNIKSADIQVNKEDIKTSTKASVNQEWISNRLKYSLGLPQGNDQERSTTSYQYTLTTDGPFLRREDTEVFITYVSLAGQLQGIPYTWTTSTQPPATYYYNPPSGEIISQRTVVEYEQVKTKEGRDMTRTKTSRWVALGLTSEGKSSFERWMKVIRDLSIYGDEVLDSSLFQWSELVFQGTEVQVSTGRAPVPAKPSDSDLAASEVVNGTAIPSDATPSDVFGNDKGWTKYLPPNTDWQDFNKDSNGDGVPNWAPFVPDQWQDYNVDTNNDGTPNWADYVPPSVDWQDYNKDSNNDGIPDWAAYVPAGQTWQSYVTDPANWQTTAIDTNNDGIPDWASNLPNGNWQDYVTDPNNWQNTAIDSDGDGVPDWADNTPIGWEDFDSDTTYVNPEPEINNEKYIAGRAVFDGQGYNDSSATVTATYEMPFAPDDYFYYDNGIRKLYRSNARAAAEKFGQTEAALDIGHAFGQNIVTNFDLTPTLDLSPVYIRLAGIEGAFLLDAASYAWGPEGMVVSSDLMLVGVTGYDGASAPATSWLRLPAAPSSIGPASGTTIEANPAKANSINIPSGFDVRNLASVFAALPANGADVFREWKSNASLVPPTLTLESDSLATGPVIAVQEFEYALTTEISAEVLATGPFFEGSETLIDPYNRRIVESTASPVLGAGQVSPTTAATNNGWQLIYNSAADEGATQTGSFGFNFTLNNVAYTTCYVNSNGYLTFGGTENQYLNLGATVPNLPKLHVGSGDFSYQRVYTKVGTDEFRIRWEGNTSYQAGAGNSNRFHEVTFFSPNANGSQWLEVRTGNVAGSVTGPLMLATATTALATGTFAANQSWVFEGNAAGTTWTVASGKHVQPPLAVVIAAPAATLTIAALAPEVATSTVVDVPAAVVTLTGLAPVVATSALVDVPLASIALTGLAPTVSTTAPTSDYWSDWVLQNYGWDSDMYPDWWAD